MKQTEQNNTHTIQNSQIIICYTQLFVHESPIRKFQSGMATTFPATISGIVWVGKR